MLDIGVCLKREYSQEVDLSSVWCADLVCTCSSTWSEWMLILWCCCYGYHSQELELPGPCHCHYGIGWTGLVLLLVLLWHSWTGLKLLLLLPLLLQIVPGCAFFASKVQLGPQGIAKVLPLGTMNDFEKEAMEAMLPELKAQIAKGIKFAQEPPTPKAA